MRLRDSLSRIFKRNPTGDLKHITDSVDNSIEAVSVDLSRLELEYIIGTSTGEWLEEWGSWFGIPRLLNESDSSYRNRILAVATKPKNTVPALIEAVRTYLGDPELNVEIYEPHLNVMKFSVSTYSGADKYQDNDYQRFGVVDIIVPTNTPGVMQNIINPVKSAGVRAYFTRMDVIGDGTPVKMYSPNSPYTDQDKWTQMQEVLTEIPLYSGAYALVPLPLSGRQVMFSSIEREFELSKVELIRRVASSSNTSLDPIYGWKWVDVHDDYFNAVSYDKEITLTAVPLRDITGDSYTEITTQLFVKATPDIFANSRTPINILLDTSIKDGFFHDTDYSSEYEIQTHQFRNLYCGSPISMSDFSDMTIGHVEDTFAYRYDEQSGVVSETIPL